MRAVRRLPVPVLEFILASRSAIARIADHPGAEPGVIPDDLVASLDHAAGADIGREDALAPGATRVAVVHV